MWWSFLQIFVPLEAYCQPALPKRIVLVWKKHHSKVARWSQTHRTTTEDKRNKVKITRLLTPTLFSSLLFSSFLFTFFLSSWTETRSNRKSVQPLHPSRIIFFCRLNYYFLSTSLLFDQEQREIRKLYLIYLHPSLSFCTVFKGT